MGKKKKVEQQDLGALLTDYDDFSSVVSACRMRRRNRIRSSGIIRNRKTRRSWNRRKNPEERAAKKLPVLLFLL